MKRAFQYVNHYGSANQEFADASVRRYEQKGVLRAGVPSPSPQSLSPFSLPPYPLPPAPFDACYAGYSGERSKKKEHDVDSYAGFAGYVSTETVSGEKKLRIPK